jgi:hypothetical protein
LNIGFFKSCGIFILITHILVLFLEFQGNQLFGMSIQFLCPMEETSLLLVNHLHHGISFTINNSDNIPICLCTISHEPFEYKFFNIILEHHLIQLFP